MESDARLFAPALALSRSHKTQQQGTDGNSDKKSMEPIDQVFGKTRKVTRNPWEKICGREEPQSNTNKSVEFHKSKGHFLKLLINI
jgi:hypothetical protein